MMENVIHSRNRVEDGIENGPDGEQRGASSQSSVEIDSVRRRTRGREAAWEQPSTASSQPNPLQPNFPVLESNTRVDQPGINLLQEIVFCLLRLDLSILKAASDAADSGDGSLFGADDRGHLNDLFSQGLLARLDMSDLRYHEGHEPQELKIRKFVQTVTKEEAMEYIRDLRTLPYYSRLLQQRITLYHLAGTRETAFNNTPLSDIKVPKTLLQDFGDDFTTSDYGEYCTRERITTTIALRFIYKIAILLHDHVARATWGSDIDMEARQPLIKRLDALDEDFLDACKTLGKPERSIAYKDTQDEALEDAFQDEGPINVAHAYDQSPRINSILAFIVPVISLISCIPTGLAYIHSSHTIGSTEDADFYQAISSSVMQLLNILILMIPIMSNVRLVKMAWFWTWGMAGVSTICALISPLLYVYVPTEWSALVAFVGGTFQCLVTLQLSFTL